MTRCTVCRHPERGRIDARIAGGESASAIAAEFGLNKMSVSRHLRNHMAEAGSPASSALDELVDALRVRALGGDVGAAREYRLSLQALEASRAATRPASDLLTSRRSGSGCDVAPGRPGAPSRGSCRHPRDARPRGRRLTCRSPRAGTSDPSGRRTRVPRSLVFVTASRPARSTR